MTKRSLSKPLLWRAVADVADLAKNFAVAMVDSVLGSIV